MAREVHPYNSANTVREQDFMQERLGVALLIDFRNP